MTKKSKQRRKELQRSRNARQQGRHFLLSIWLVLNLLVYTALALGAGSTLALSAAETSESPPPNVKGFSYLSLLGGVCGVVSVVAIVRWKKWGCYGLLASSLVCAAAGATVNRDISSLLTDVTAPIVGMIVLYGILQLGIPSGWARLK